MINRDKIRKEEIDKLNELPVHILSELYGESAYDSLVIKGGKIVDVVSIDA